MRILKNVKQGYIQLEIGVDVVGEEELSLHIELKGTILVLGMREVKFLKQFLEENKDLLKI